MCFYFSLEDYFPLLEEKCKFEYSAGLHVDVHFLFLLWIVSLIQLLIAKGASLTAENANGYLSTQHIFVTFDVL